MSLRRTVGGRLFIPLTCLLLLCDSRLPHPHRPPPSSYFYFFLTAGSRPKCGAWRKVPAHLAKTVLPDKANPKVPCVGKGTVSTSGWLTSVRVVRPPHRRYPCPDCGFVYDSVKNRQMYRGNRRCRDLARSDSPRETPTPPVVEDSSPVFRRRVHPINPAILVALMSTPPQVLEESRDS